MGKKKSFTVKGVFQDNHNPVARDLRTPKYRKRIEGNKKAKDKRGGPKIELE